MKVMMNPTIDEMLTLTAEIAEELLNVKDAGAQTIPDTLKLKIAKLAELASSLPEEASMPPVQESSEEPSGEAAFEVEQEMAEAIVEEQSAELAELAEEPQPAEDAENVVEGESAEDATLAEDAILAEDAELAEDQEEVLEEVVEVAPEKPATFEAAPVDAAPVDAAPVEAAPVEAATVEQSPVIEEVERPHLDPMDIMRAFSINDKFFFRREIFGGSKERMDEALVTIAYLRNLPELQAYLVEILNLNLNETPGREFYDKLKIFF